MKIGLLECDHVLEKYKHLGGDYRDMFTTLLPEVDFQFFDVCNGQFPKSVNDCDGYICTGSKHSVYEDIDWVKRLEDFVSQLYKKEKIFVGICFGHQMLAKALGGKVIKSRGGWNVGVHEFEIINKVDWMQPFKQEINLLMMCQDQVVEMPENSILLANTVDCPIGIFRVGETMIGIQAHPEFPKSYEKALLLDRIDRIGSGKVEEAIYSLKRHADESLVANWIMNFLKNKKKSNF